MVTVSELIALKDREAMLEVRSGGHGHNIHCPITVLDVRVVHNQVHCLVTPKDGEGKQWVSIARLRDRDGNQLEP